MAYYVTSKLCGRTGPFETLVKALDESHRLEGAMMKKGERPDVKIESTEKPRRTRARADSGRKVSRK
jgi:hypothetical protein